MLKSMTGFGKYSCVTETKTFTVEVRSLNSKQTDINCKIPVIYREKELDIRNVIGKSLIRGKIDVFISFEQVENIGNSLINTGVVKSYFKQLECIAEDLKIESSERLLQAVLKLPDVVRQEREEIDEKEWITVKDCLQEATSRCEEHRLYEGQKLERDVLNRVDIIVGLLEDIKVYEPKRLDGMKKRIKDNLNELFEKDDYDKNRFEQEMIYYIEKYDITEEKVRLNSHCKYFKETCMLHEPVGKKLGFIVQEMGREINTIGSKASDHDIQRIVVMMKDELEKIKEQLMNIL